MHTEPHAKTKSLDRPRPVGQESKLFTAAITLVLAAGVVGWQHLLHATLLVRSDDAWSAHLPHLM